MNGKLLVCGALSLALTACGGIEKDAKAKANEFLGAIRAQSFDAAYQLVSPKWRERSYNHLEAFKAAIRKVPPLYQSTGEQWQSKSTICDETECRFVGNYTPGDGEFEIEIAKYGTAFHIKRLKAWDNARQMHVLINE